MLSSSGTWPQCLSELHRYWDTIIITDGRSDWPNRTAIELGCPVKGTIRVEDKSLGLAVFKAHTAAVERMEYLDDQTLGSSD